MDDVEILGQRIVGESRVPVGEVAVAVCVIKLDLFSLRVKQIHALILQKWAIVFHEGRSELDQVSVLRAADTRLDARGYVSLFVFYFCDPSAAFHPGDV